MIVFLSIILFILIAFIIFGISGFFLQRDDYKRKRIELIAKYGPPTIIINNLTAYLFEKQRVLAIYGIEHSFDSILDFRVNDSQSYSITTSSSSMIGRTLVGGVLLGGAGAIVGANTASKNVTSNGSNYKIFITTKDLSDPVIEYQTTNEATANKLISVLKIIIDKNNTNKNGKN